MTARLHKLMSLRSCLEDPQYLGGADMLGGASWGAWRVILVAAMGEPLTDDERVIFQELTGRDREPGVAVEELWAIVGRRGGKSRAIAALAAYLAACIDYRGVLAPGQFGLVPIIAASREQAGEIFNYVAGIFADAPGFAGLLASAPTANTITLTARIEIQVRAASFRRARGFTAVAAIGDEAAFWSVESSANPDAEVLAALRPSLATTGGILAVISSPYARRGELYATYRRDFGAAGDPLTLVVKAPSKAMNPELSDRIIARAYEKDPAAAASEYGAEFRNDVEDFLNEEILAPCILADHAELPRWDADYFGFVDAASGSGGDSMTMAIGCRGGSDAIVAKVVEKRPPFDPEQTVAEFAEVLRAYGVDNVVGDKWAIGFVEAAFRRQGIRYEPSAAPKSDLYRELATMLNAGRVKIIDDKRLQQQLLGLERRTARGGRDSIDHAPNGHDDVANAVAGLVATKLMRKGIFTGIYFGNSNYNMTCIDGEEVFSCFPSTQIDRQDVLHENDDPYNERWMFRI